MRKVHLDDLVGATEIADRAQVRLDTVDKWRRRHDTFPEPVKELAAGPIWLWSEIREWLDATGR